MQTLRLSCNTKNGNRIYIMESPSLWRIFLSIPFFALAVILFLGSIALAVYLAGLAGSFSIYLGGLTMVIFPLVGFVIGIILAAILVQVIRYRIFKTYGYLTIENSYLVFYKGNKPREQFELNNLICVRSRKDEYGNYYLSLEEKGHLKSLSQIFTGSEKPFHKYTRDASALRRFANYKLTDELLAAWLNVDLLRDEQKITINKNSFAF